MAIQIAPELYLLLMTFLKMLNDNGYDAVKDKTIEEIREMSELEKERSEDLQKRQEDV